MLRRRLTIRINKSSSEKEKLHPRGGRFGNHSLLKLAKKTMNSEIGGYGEMNGMLVSVAEISIDTILTKRQQENEDSIYSTLFLLTTML